MIEAGERMRAFFCLPIERNVVSAVDRIARQLRDAADMRASWVRTENYHVTLRFLGEIDPLLTVDLKRIARKVTRALAPFELPLERLGCFPSVESARVLWIGSDASPAFCGLAASLHHELSRLGFPPERNQTVAHVTLARIKGKPPPGLARVLDRCDVPTDLAAHAERLTLMESVLTPSGAVYTPLFSTPFGGRPPDGDRVP